MRRAAPKAALVLRVTDLYDADSARVERAVNRVLAGRARAAPTRRYVVATGAGTLVTLERRVSGLAVLRRPRIIAAMRAALAAVGRRLQSPDPAREARESQGAGPSAGNTERHRK